MVLDGIFYWWSTMGVYTCIVFLENAQHHRQHLRDWHAKSSLQNVQRNVAQNLLPILGLDYNSLPEIQDHDKTYETTPLWQFPPSQRKLVDKERRRKEAKELEKARQQLRRAEARAKEEARKRAERTKIEALKGDALTNKATVEVGRLVIEGYPLPIEPQTRAMITEEIYLPAPAPLLPYVSVINPDSELRVKKLTQDAQLANLVSCSLGESNSPAVLHAQSQTNIMTAMLLEFQENRRERKALEEKIRLLEEKNQALEVSHYTMAVQFTHMEKALFECRAALRLSTPPSELGTLDEQAPQTEERPESPPFDMVRDLAVDRGMVTEDPSPPIPNPGKRARERSNHPRDRNYSRSHSNYPRDNKRARSPSRERAHSPQPGPSRTDNRSGSVTDRPGNRGSNPNYQGRNFKPNFRGRGNPKGRGNPSNRRGNKDQNRRGSGFRN
jgi:hypothetical protein